MGQRLSKRFVDAARASEKVQFFWDENLKGFGLKVSPSGLKTYVVQYRGEGGRRGRVRRLSIGRHGSPWTPDQARSEARRLLGEVAHGEDPMAARQAKRKDLTIAELCDLYLEEGVSTKKAATVATDKGRIERHIKPIIGEVLVSDAKSSHVRSLLKKVAEGSLPKDGLGPVADRLGGKGTASRTIGLLGGIFSFAIELGYRSDNPVHGVKRFPDRKNQRFLTHEELGRLLALLGERESQGANPKAAMIIRLLALTGARRGEIEQLKWSEVSLAESTLHLEDSKTGQKSVPISATVAELLKQAEQFRERRNPYVFPSERGDGFYVGTTKVWRDLRKEFGDEKLRIHDLRHSFASLAVASGASLPMIGALLGHRDSATTQRYAHLKADPLRSIADQIGADLLGDGESAT
ncbi:site-specific integrase [Cohaesibacter intestini]|uniref:site-specific integrase n=1 Tax=Cohaesibacter intestini TaxID=2211145 RepID=UPI000DEBC7FF|nr:site-specific integrase [Cohaesibacter intestini]